MDQFGENKQLIYMRRSVFALLVVISVFAIALLNRCYYDNEAYLYAGNGCDTSSVTYSATIAPIMSQNCNSCHSGGSPAAGVNTDSYAGVKLIADNGSLVNTTTGATKLMPTSGKMDDCTVAKIGAWVSAGAQNN